MVSLTSKSTAWLLITAIAAIFASKSRAGNAAACSPIKGKLVRLEHGVGGNLSISKSCGLKVSSFRYDGKAPSVYWWAAPSCNYVDIVKNGYRISNTRVSKAYKGTSANFKLNPGVMLNNAGCISLYCEEFKADLGHVAVKSIG